jgi:hypothetical protein
MPQRNRRLDDHEAHARALEHLAALAGADCLADVCWDPDHHLQGHVEVAGRHLVVIAARDDTHMPRVLTESDWDALRHGCRTFVGAG